VGRAFKRVAHVSNNSDAILAEALDAIDGLSESDWHVVRSIDGLTDAGLRNAYPSVSYITGFAKRARTKKIVLALLTDDRMRRVWQSIDKSLESAHKALLEDVKGLSEARSKRPLYFDPEKFDKDESKISCLIARECVRELSWSSPVNSKAKYIANLRKISKGLDRIAGQIRHDTHFNEGAHMREVWQGTKNFPDRTAAGVLDMLSWQARLSEHFPNDRLRRGGLAQTRKLNLIDALGQVFLRVFEKPMDSEVAVIVSVVTAIEVSPTEVKTERTRYSVDPLPFQFR
jgi:hypothetical protein